MKEKGPHICSIFDFLLVHTHAIRRVDHFSRSVHRIYIVKYRDKTYTQEAFQHKLYICTDIETKGLDQLGVYC